MGKGPNSHAGGARCFGALINFADWMYKRRVEILKIPGVSGAWRFW